MNDRVTTHWLEANLGEPWLRVLDVRAGDRRDESGPRLRLDRDDGPRFVELGPRAGFARTTPRPPRPAIAPSFFRGHVPGATSLDVAHLLFDAEGLVVSAPELALAMSGLGVDDAHTIVLVADGLLTLASVTSWALRRFGHSETYVLGGGFARWASEGRAISKAVTPHRTASFTARAPGSSLPQAALAGASRRGRDRRLTT